MNRSTLFLDLISQNDWKFLNWLQPDYVSFEILHCTCWAWWVAESATDSLLEIALRPVSIVGKKQSWKPFLNLDWIQISNIFGLLVSHISLQIEDYKSKNLFSISTKLKWVYNFGQ